MAKSIIRREPFNTSKFRWPKRLLKKLGKMTDKALAALAGVHFLTVTKERRRLGIAPFSSRRPPVEWTPARIALLGTAPDRVVAAELGIHPASVATKRRLLQIPAFRPAPERIDTFWTPTRLARLGTAFDGTLAKDWRISRARVAYRRNVLRIPPFEPRPASMRWTARHLRLIGKVGDSRLATIWGIREETVTRQRLKMGLPAVRLRPRKVVVNRALRSALSRSLPEAVRDTGIGRSTLSRLRSQLGIPVPPRKSAWTKPALARLGKSSDAELAAELGLKLGTVKLKRNQAGIKVRQTRPWSAAEDRVLRKLSAEATAKTLSRTLKSIHHRRVKLGLVALRPPSRWTPKNIALLGKVSDAELARRFGITSGAVRAARQLRGIKPAPHSSTPPAASPPKPAAP